MTEKAPRPRGAFSHPHLPSGLPFERILLSLSRQVLQSPRGLRTQFFPQPKHRYLFLMAAEGGSGQKSAFSSGRISRTGR